MISFSHFLKFQSCLTECKFDEATKLYIKYKDRGNLDEIVKIELIKQIHAVPEDLLCFAQEHLTLSEEVKCLLKECSSNKLKRDEEDEKKTINSMDLPEYMRRLLIIFFNGFNGKMEPDITTQIFTLIISIKEGGNYLKDYCDKMAAKSEEKKGGDPNNDKKNMKLAELFFNGFDGNIDYSLSGMALTVLTKDKDAAKFIITYLQSLV
jgi:hypothetical protein